MRANLLFSLSVAAILALGSMGASAQEADVQVEAAADLLGLHAEAEAELVLGGHRSPGEVTTQVYHEGDPAQEWSLHVTGTTELDFPSFQAVYGSADGSLPTAVGSTETQAEAWLAGETLHLVFAMEPTTVAHGSALLLLTANEAGEYGIDRGYDIRVDEVAPGLHVVNITATPFVCCSDGSPDPSDSFELTPTAEDLAPALADAVADGDPVPEDEDGNPDPLGGGFTIQATTAINGYVYFTRPGSTTAIPCRLCLVKVYDDDNTSGNEYLGSTLANYGGYFTITVSNDDAWAGQDPYLVIELDYGSAAAKVMDTAGTVYKHQTGVLKKDCPNTSCSVTTTFTPSGNTHFAFWIWEAMMRGWNTWNTAGYGVPKINVEFPSATGPARVSPSLSKMFIPYNERTNQITHAHEYGHWAMYKAQNNFVASGACSATKTVRQQHNGGCAWNEGFADFSALVTMNTNTITWSNTDGSAGPWMNMETMACSFSPCTIESGGTVPVRVAATMNDLRDSNPDGTQDTSSIAYSFTTIVARLRAGTAADITGYFNLWKTQGATQETHFRNVASQNTITV